MEVQALCHERARGVGADPDDHELQAIILENKLLEQVVCFVEGSRNRPHFTPPAQEQIG